MPVRSLSSSVLKWPDAQEVNRAVRRWASQMMREHLEVVRIGYFGSYARGDWGVGSDLDLVVVVRKSDQPFLRRAIDYDATGLPVPADVLVYTEEEWEALRREQFIQTLEREVIWLYSKGDS